MKTNQQNIRKILAYAIAVLFLSTATLWCGPIFSVEDVDKSHLLVCIEYCSSLETTDDPRNGSSQCTQDEQSQLFISIDIKESKIFFKEFFFWEDSCFSKLSPRSPPVVSLV